MALRHLLRLLSILLAAICSFMAICFLFAILWKEPEQTILAYLPPLTIGFGSFALMYFVCAKDGRPILSQREGLLFVTLSWVMASLIGALPFSLSGFFPTYIDSVFETMSGFTTTGASILSDVEVLPRSLHLWRSTTHWLGGMGIVVLTVAIFPLLGFGGLRLMEAEAPGPSVDKITPRISSTARIFWLLYVGMTAVQVILLVAGGMSLFDSICHAFGTMATGGFSTKNKSLGNWNSPYLDVVCTVFMLLAGMNFTLHFRFLSGKPSVMFRDSEARTYVAIFSVATLIVAIDLLTSRIVPGFAQALRHAAFNTASILTTTGFATTDFAIWPNASQGVLLILMFIGGCAGSTGGGIKVIRIVTFFKMSVTELRYIMNPRGVYGVFVNKKNIRKNIVYDTAALIFLYFLTIFTSILILSLAGYDLTISLTATMATLGNIGPGLGRVGPTGNYGFFPWWIKIWLTFIMLVGRLEVYTVFVLFTNAFWRRGTRRRAGPVSVISGSSSSV